jgi:transcriptional regulator with XRE-family HTH domain
MTFQAKLTRLVADRNKSEVSRRAGLIHTAVSSYIARGCIPRADIAMRIARALNVSVEWLLDDSAGWPPVWANYPEAEHAEHSCAA